MSIDKKRKEIELERVNLAKKELEFRIDERLHEIEKLKEHIKVQDQRIEELKKELKTL